MLHLLVGVLQFLCSVRDALLEVPVDIIKFRGQQVDARAYRIHLVPGRRNRNPGRQVPCSNANDTFDDLVEPRVLAGERAWFLNGHHAGNRFNQLRASVSREK